MSENNHPCLEIAFDGAANYIERMQLREQYKLNEYSDAAGCEHNEDGFACTALFGKLRADRGGECAIREARLSKKAVSPYEQYVLTGTPAPAEKDLLDGIVHVTENDC